MDFLGISPFIYRIIWGFLFSRVGFKILFCLCASMTAISFIAIMATNHHGIYITFYTINSVALGGMMVIFPNVSLIIFGKKIGERVYSHYWVAFSLGNLFQFIITLILTNNPVTADDYS
jgi:MFS family permease